MNLTSGDRLRRLKPTGTPFGNGVRKSALNYRSASASWFSGHSSPISFAIDLGVATAAVGAFWPRGPVLLDNRLALLLTVTLAVAIAARWRLPLVAFAVSLTATAIGWVFGLCTDPMLATAWCLYPQAVRRGTQSQPIGVWISMALILLAATSGSPDSDTAVQRAFGGCLAIGASWMLGCAEARRLASAQEAIHQQDLARRAQQQVAISREVHDVVGHVLTVIRAEADVARATASTEDELLQSLADIEDRAGGALEEVQQLVRTLRPGGDGHSSAPSLPKLLTAARVSGLKVCSDIELPELPSATQAVVSRVVQEALSNVVRHSDASSCTVTAGVAAGASPGRDVLTVRVEDNGTGLPAHQAPGAGLTGMRERVEAVGGTLSVSGLSQGGTRVLARLPLRVEP